MGCAATPRVPGLAPARVEDLPFVAGDDGLCGPAVLAMMLAHAAAPTPLPDLVRAVYLPGRQGSLQAEMLAAVRRRRRLVATLESGWRSLADELGAGHPVAALVNLSLPWLPRWHYLVVTALDPAHEAVRVHSGQQADAWWPMATFESVWARSGHWAFVVLRPGELAPSVSEAATVQALLALERSADPASAMPWWLAASRRWPDSVTAQVGAGQSLVAAGDPGAAITLLDDAARRLDRAVLWNNLAALLASRDDTAGARRAGRRALALAETREPEWLPAVRRTLAELGD